MVAPYISIGAPAPGPPPGGVYVARPIHSNTAQSSPPRMLVISCVQSGKIAAVSREIDRRSLVDAVFGSAKVAPGANNPRQSPLPATSIAFSARRAHASQSTVRDANGPQNTPLVRRL